MLCVGSLLGCSSDTSTPTSPLATGATGASGSSAQGGSGSGAGSGSGSGGGSGPAYISVNTRPWTKVYVDGRFVRNTPLMRHQVTPGTHRLTLINEDFNIRQTVSVRVKAGETKQIVRNLVR